MIKLCCFKKTNPHFSAFQVLSSLGVVGGSPNTTQFAVCGQDVTLAQYIIHKCLASRCYLQQILGAMISEINGSALLVVPNVTTHSSKSSIPTLCYLSHGQSINQYRKCSHRYILSTVQIITVQKIQYMVCYLSAKY